jgi:large subunit ribosomal protein L13
VPVTMRSSAYQRTYSPKKAELVHQWHVLDADGQTLGRLATQAASLLRGKHNPRYVPHMDCGDYVVIVNAEKIVVTGRKTGQKMYYRHTGYPGGLKEETLERLMNRKPERVLELAIEGMLPHTALGRAMYKKLRVYKGPSHPHLGQLAAPAGIQSAPRATSMGAPAAKPAPVAAPPTAAAPEPTASVAPETRVAPPAATSAAPAENAAPAPAVEPSTTAETIVAAPTGAASAEIPAAPATAASAAPEPAAAADAGITEESK